MGYNSLRNPGSQHQRDNISRFQDEPEGAPTWTFSPTSATGSANCGRRTEARGGCRRKPWPKNSANTVSRWETVTYKPDINDLEKLSRFFGVSILEFFPQQEALHAAPMSALLRAAKDLPAEDIEELRKYAEFRRARSMFKGPRPRPGRKPKLA